MRILSSVVYPATCFLPVSIFYYHHRCTIGTQFVRYYNFRLAIALYNAGEQCWLTDAEALLAEAQQERRTAVDPLYDEVAEWLSLTKKMETCMREIMQQVAFVDEATSAAAMTPLMQHRIRGALNAAGFESTGRKFSAGDYKGMTIFALVLREAR